tara:strand:- start:805 stop:942 length:138 start_codon:yes stop_codon:yes gene_type:complete
MAGNLDYVGNITEVIHVVMESRREQLVKHVEVVDVVVGTEMPSCL